jgi:hypothetical protein
VSITPDSIQEAIKSFYSKAIAEFLAKMDQAIAAGEEFLENWEFDAQSLPDLRQDANRAEIPQPVLDAYSYYAQEVMDQDWGVVHAGRVTIDDQLTYVVRVITDGDDGWLEVFGQDGTPIGTARTNAEQSCWGDCETLRAQVQSGEMPEEIGG